MNEALRQGSQSTVTDGRHPIEQGAAASYWQSVQSEIASRNPSLPDLHLDTLSPEAIVNPEPTVIVTSEAIAKEKRQEGLFDSARNAWDFVKAVATSKKLSPLAAPALALTIAACNASGAPTSEPTNTPKVDASPTATLRVTPPLTDTETSKPTVAPTLAPTQAPTPEPTQAATPEPTAVPTPELITFQTMLENKPDKPVTLDSFVNSTQAAFAETNMLQKYPAVARYWNDCQNGVSGGGIADKVQACAAVIASMLREAQATGNQTLYTAGETGVYYIMDTYQKYAAGSLDYIKGIIK